ncbi:MAG: BatA domain-containing protein [Bacteroidia bacterium]|nr:BatA domain-containing protein [Bacteroidia bacterium]MDW8014986.1 BatA domain-containing protein [Bacteroidia bacterium]
MNWLYPAFLWGFVALVVPIIVHFFYLRRARRYEFSQAWLVERLKQASRPYLRLRHLLLLLLRLALISTIVILFARPYFSASSLERGEKASVLVILDVSPSMKPVFESARALLREAVLKDPASYEYRLLCTDSYLPKGSFSSKRVFLERLAEAKPADMGLPLSSILENFDLFFHGAMSSNRKVYIVSDFQRFSVGKLEQLRLSELEGLVLFPVKGFSATNAYIDSVEVREIGDAWHIRYHLSATQNRLYTIHTEGKRFSLSPGWYDFQRKKDPKGYTYQAFQIEGDEIDFDNQVWIGLQDRREVRSVKWLGPEESRKAFQKLGQLLGVAEDNPTSTVEGSSVLIASLREMKNTLLNYVAQGGRLVLFPPPNLQLSEWSRFPLAGEIAFEGKALLSASSVTLRVRHEPFWEGVFLRREALTGFLAEPLALQALYLFKPQGGTPLLEELGGNVLLWEVPWGRGRIYLFSFPWQESFANHSLFVPLFERIYSFTAATGDNWVVWLGTRAGISLPTETEGRVVMRHVHRSDVEYLPPLIRQGGKAVLKLGDQPMVAGVYEVEVGERVVGYVGVNVSPLESVPDFLALESWRDLGTTIEVRSWEEGGLMHQQIGWGWKDWWLWLLIAFVWLIAIIYWERRLIRPLIEPSR